LVSDKLDSDLTRTERKRQRLIDAAIAVFLDKGMAQFTSAHIAAQAGMHKPTFYAHFKNVEDCLQAVALHIAKTNALEMLVLQTTVATGRWLNDSVFDTSRHFIEQLLRSVKQHEALYRILSRCAHDAGPLGEAVRAINSHVRERWIEHFWRVAVHHQLDPKHFKEVAEMADHIVGITYVAIARVLDGRVADLSAEAARVARYDFAIVAAEFSRMRSESTVTIA
jgi:AcrR family transcriptional regulator